MDLSRVGLEIFNDRYAARDDFGNIVETPEQAVRRICRTAAAAENNVVSREHWQAQFEEMIDLRWFIPSTPIWANIGKSDRMGQPAACYVLELKDDLQSMYQTLLESAMIAKYGGGIGYNFSPIRPRGDLIHTTKGKASGPVELLRLYDCSAAMIKQGGIRQGAYMGILNCDHPDIEEFIDSKLKGGFNNFTLSVGISSRFMEAVATGSSWDLHFGGVIHKSMPAVDLWDQIIRAAWSCGDPGLVFLDQIQATNPIPSRTINATNPCGEQPLSPGESCLLGSINLAMMTDPDGKMEWDRLRLTARTAVRFLDNLIDVGEYPFEYIAQHTKQTRKVGLGILGLHDLLVKMGKAYDSPDGIDVSSKIMAFIRTEALAASAELGLEKGNFPLWEESVYARDHLPRRNASCLTVAPTGTISLLAGTEGYGIEPIFAIAYQKTFLRHGKPEHFRVISPLFLQACQQQGVSAQAINEVAATGSCQGVKGIPENIQHIFKGAREIDPKDHLAMQIALQQQVDNAISKTINLPPQTSLDQVGEIFMNAWKQGLKGITVFREGCKAGVIQLGHFTGNVREEL